MKKVMIALMMVVMASTTSFAKVNNDQVKTSLGTFNVNTRKATIIKQ